MSIARHLFATGWGMRRAFDAATLAAIEQAITDTERSHGGEIRFAVEASRGAIDLMRGVTPRQHAVHAFARLGMWDTEANNGVLLYMLLADHAIELVADRGFRDRVGDAEWRAVCGEIEAGLAGGDPVQAVVDGIARISGLLAAHFPAAGGGRDELSDRPVLL